MKRGSFRQLYKAFLSLGLTAAILSCVTLSAHAQTSAPATEASSISTAAQNTAAPTAPGFAEVMMQMLPMFIAVFFVFHLLVTRPQQQKLKNQQDLLSSLKRGENVITTGGIYGRVAAVEKDHVLLEIAQNVRVKCEASAISKREEVKVEVVKNAKS